MSRSVSYNAARAVNADQYAVHFIRRYRETGENYPPEDLRTLPLCSYYFYWAVGDHRGQWQDSDGNNDALQEMTVSLTTEDAADADGATAQEVLDALQERAEQVTDFLKLQYLQAIASLLGAISSDASAKVEAMLADNSRAS